MSKYGICWLHRCTYRSGKQVPTDHEFVTPSEKTLCQVHLTSEKVQGNMPQWSQTKESRVKKHFPTEKAFPQDINQFKEKTKFYSGSRILKKLRDEFLKNKDIISSTRRSTNLKILKQQCKVDTFNSCIREFQRQAHANRLEMDYVNIVGMKILEESKPDFTDNLLNQERHFEILAPEVSMKWKN